MTGERPALTDSPTHPDRFPDSRELTVLVRPYSAATTLREQMAALPGG